MFGCACLFVFFFWLVAYVFLWLPVCLVVCVFVDCLCVCMFGLLVYVFGRLADRVFVC